jgi:hypothetical protein
MQFRTRIISWKIGKSWETGGILPGPLRGGRQGVNSTCRGAHVNPIFQKKRNLVLLSFQIVSEILLCLQPTNCTLYVREPAMLMDHRDMTKRFSTY